MRKLKVGIIGVGRIGRVQIQAMRDLGMAELTAVLSRNPGRAAFLASELMASGGAGHPPIQAYSDLAAFLAAPEVEVVHICTPNLQHYDAAKACLRAGKPVLCEKPLTADSAQSAELAALAAELRLPTAVNFVYRHYPTLARLKDMIASGELGEIYAVRGGFLQGQMLSDQTWDWRVEACLGGPSRAMADIGSHWCDLARWLVGEEIAEICADFATFVPERLAPSEQGALTASKATAGPPVSGACAGQVAQSPGVVGSRRVVVDTEDYASALFRFRSGVRGSFSVSQTTAGAKSAFSIAVDGSRASARWERERADILWLGRPDRSPEELRFGELLNPGWEDFRDAAQRALLASFYSQILEGRRGAHADFVDGHKIVEVVEAALASSKARTWVHID